MGKHFLWDPVEDNIVKEIDDSGTTIADYTTEPYLYGDLISQHRGGQSSFYHYDGQGSTTSLTDSAATVTDTYAYSAFGKVTVQAGSTANPFQYIGQSGYYRHEVTQAYFARRRILSVVKGRWLSADPIGDVNALYIYADNSPIAVIDPSGLFGEAADDLSCGWTNAKGISAKVFFKPRAPHVFAELGLVTLKTDPSPLEYQLHALLLIAFDLKALDFKSCECCCDKVGIVQVARGFAWAYDKDGNIVTKIDVGPAVDKAIPYPRGFERGKLKYGNTGAPCGGDIRIGMSDIPGLSEPIRNDRTGKTWPLVEQKFETCVVCLEGIEGIVGGGKKAIDKIMVYGCISSSIRAIFYDYLDKTKVRLTLGSKTANDELGAKVPKQLEVNEASAAPTQFFAKGIDAFPNTI